MRTRKEAADAMEAKLADYTDSRYRSFREHEVKEILTDYYVKEWSQTAIADKFKTSPSAIHQIVQGQTHRHLWREVIAELRTVHHLPMVAQRDTIGGQ